MTHRRKRGVAAVALAVIFALLTACAGVPTDSSVHEGQQITGQQEISDGTIFRPTGPIPGDSPTDIVTGFLNAATGQSGDYSVARSFLIGDLAAQWRPHESVLIYSSTPKKEQHSSDDTVQVITHSVAEVDSTGHYFERSKETVTDFKLRLNQDGEWRISEAPDGIVVPDHLFKQLFSAHKLYFYDSSFRFLVPDLRWYPTRYSSRLTQIISSLLDGPSEFLSNGVLFSAFPEETHLAIDSVVVTDGVAQIDLNSPVLALNDQQRKLMFAQLQASVFGVGGVNRINVAVDRTDLEIVPFTSGGPDKNPEINSDPFVFQDGQLYLVQGPQLVPVLTFRPELEAMSTDALFFHERLNRSVVTNEQGIWYVQPPNAARNISDSRPRVNPLMDNRGAAWWVQDGVAGVQVYLDGTVTHIAEGVLDSDGVVQMAMSRDDTRLIVVRQLDGNQGASGTFQLELYGVIRNSGGGPVDLNEGMVLYRSAGQVIDAVWIDDIKVVYGWQDPEDNFRISTFEIGGQNMPQGLVPEFVKIGAANAFASVRILRPDGVLLEQSQPQRWFTLLEDVQLLVDAR